MERAAKRHGLNRSQVYAQAAERYVAELESRDVTEAINAVVDIAYPDESVERAVEASRRFLASGDEEW